MRLVVVGEAKGGKERILGEVTESFVITPIEPVHTSSFKAWPDEWFHRNRFVELRLDVQVGGQSFGRLGISYDEPASFIKVPVVRR